MKTLNKVYLIGAAGRDPEIKTTAGGSTVASFSIATSERFKDSTGNWQDRTEWHNLVAFAKTAEIVRDYVKKGSQIHVEGKLQTQSWEDKDSGKKMYRTQIFIESLILLGGNRDKQQEKPKNSAPTWSDAGSESQDFSDADIPF